MAGKPIQAWFDEYAENHRNPVNMAIHWFAVPVIYFTLVGLTYGVPSINLGGLGRIAPVNVLVTAVAAYYLLRSFTLAMGMLLFSMLCISAARWLDLHAPWPLWAICLCLFVLAWTAQFIGHGVEGKKPSFLKDLQFLLIGPAWLLAKGYNKLGIAY
jgi:uncharacterized membrane protein YGL010W